LVSIRAWYIVSAATRTRSRHLAFLGPYLSDAPGQVSPLFARCHSQWPRRLEWVQAELGELVGCDPLQLEAKRGVLFEIVLYPRHARRLRRMHRLGSLG
jgi:hypothetical protein